MKRLFVVLLVLFLTAGFVACGGGGGDDSSTSSGNGSGSSGDGGSNNYSISGKVTYSGDNLQAVTISLTGSISAIATTNSNGVYSFSGLPNGDYTITASKSGYDVVPSSMSAAVYGFNLVNKNFFAAPYIAALVGSWDVVYSGLMYPCPLDSFKGITFSSDGTFVATCSSSCNPPSNKDYSYGSYIYNLYDTHYGVYYITINVDSFTYCGAFYSGGWSDGRSFQITNYGNNLDWWFDIAGGEASLKRK